MKVTQNRLDLMDTVTIDDIVEKDPLTMNMRDFTTVREILQHRVIQSEVPRPDLMAFLAYNSVGLWWFLLSVNGVIDPYSTPESTLLTVPSLLDYFDWYREQRGTT